MNSYILLGLGLLGGGFFALYMATHPYDGGNGGNGGNGTHTVNIVNDNPYGSAGYTEPVGQVTQDAGTTLAIQAYFMDALYNYWYLDGVLVAQNTDAYVVSFDADHELVVSFFK